MIIKLLGSAVDFSLNRLENVDLPEDGTDIPVEPEETIPEVFTTFASTYSRSTMTEAQKTGLAKFLYNLKQQGILGKVRQLYIPCVMPDWEHCFLNVARYFNSDGTVEYPTVTGVSNSSLGLCFDLCDYGIYKTNASIGWGDCITHNWTDADVTFDNWHILAFKPAQMDASTNTHSGGLNLRGSGGNTNVSFAITGDASATQRRRCGWGSGTVKIDGASVTIKDSLFAFPEGWGNGTHDPFCVGLSIKDNKMMTPSSNYQEFGYNNRNLVNQIDEMELTGQYELPTTAMTGNYSWGGYCGASVSTQQSLATSIVSIGQGLTADEVQQYMDITDEFMEIMGIKNNNWNPDNIEVAD